VLLRPPAILGAGETSIWNSLRPAEIRDDPSERRVNPDRSFAWVHVDDLVTLAADLASGRIGTAEEAERGPVPGACTAVNVAAGPATARDYYETVTRALGVEPVWVEDPSWTGRILADRAHGWGWRPTVTLDRALAELGEGLRAAPTGAHPS
jgi:nucleoside-diphosphate-sugar epimerase